MLTKHAHSDDARPRGVDQGYNGAPRRTVHLLVCTNALYLQHAAVCLTSALSNNPDLFFDIAIVSRPAERLDEEKLLRSLSSFTNKIVRFQQFELPKIDLPLNPRAHYTLDNWTRLWVGEFFSENVDRVLYLDSDLVVVGSLAPLWRIDLEGALLGAIDIPGSQRGVTHLGIPKESGYFNSGVLLIDLRQWRATHALTTLLAYIAAHPELMMRDVDQEALNGCFHTRTKRLEHRWNAITPFFKASESLPLSSEYIDEVRRDACIIHFNGALKPWSFFCDHPRTSEYYKYLRLTEWRDYIPADRTLGNRIRKKASQLLPERAKETLRQAVSAVYGKG